MIFAIVMVSSAVICIPNFIKIGSSIQKLIAGDTHTHRTRGSHKSTSIF
jgi:hypothetical protein